MAVSTGKTTTQSSNLKGSGTGPGGMFGGGGGGGTNKPAAGATTKSQAPGSAKAASKAPASNKPNAAKTQQQTQKQAAQPKSQTAGRVPGTSAAAAKNTALGKVAQTAKRNAQPSGVVGPGRGFIAGSPTGKNYVSVNAPAQMQRMGAVSRGPGVLSGARPEAIARTTAFGESPAGLRAPGLASSLSRAALNNQSLFSMRGATPAQQALLGRIAPSALHVSMTTGLDPRTVLGQAMTESTTGRHASKVSALARNANNLFGIKGWGPQSEYWDGATRTFPTKEVFNGKTVTVRHPFRSYATPNQSVLDYGNLIERRYSSAADDPTVTGQLSRIRSGGYATHPSSDYVRMGVRNAARLSPGGVTADGTQIASAAPVPTTAVRPTQVASAALGSIPRPVPRPDDLRAPVPRPNPRPLQSFVTGDPRAGMPPGAFPAARPPVPNARPLQSFVAQDPRLGYTPGSYPNAPMQSPVMGDPRANMPPGAYPAAPPPRMQSPVVGDPRADLPPGAFPAKPASVFADPRVGMPVGGYPRARPISIVGDPRAGMPPGAYFNKDQSRVAPTPMGGPIAPQMVRPEAVGSYPAAVNLQEIGPRNPIGGMSFNGVPGQMNPPRMSPFGNVGQEYHQHTAPPTPSQYRNEAPPAAPHPGTPASQTAETEPSFETYGEENVLTYLQQQAGIFPRDNYLASIGGSNSNAGRYNQGAQNAIGGTALGGGRPNSPQQFTPGQLNELLLLMQAKGATPEEIAFVEAAIQSQTV